MTGFPVDSLSKFIPEYIAIRPMEDDDDLEIEIDMHLTGNETYEQLNQEFTDWKRGLEVYVAEDKKSSKGATVQKARGGAFQIVSQLLAYPVEKKTSSEKMGTSILTRRLRMQ